MNESNLPPYFDLDAIFASSRAHPPDTSAIEYAFETRLMARLRMMRSTDSIWAIVSWRLAPFFAVCLGALTLWYSEIAAETTEAEQFAYITSPDALDAWISLD